MLNHRLGSFGDRADTVIRVDRSALTAIMVAGGDLGAAISDGKVEVTGNLAAVQAWLAALEKFDPQFNVVEP